VSQFAPEDSQGTIDLVSNGDITFEADRDQDGAGDLVFRTGGVERARIKHDGSGTGWPNVLGGSVSAAPASTDARIVYGTSFSWSAARAFVDSNKDGLIFLDGFTDASGSDSPVTYTKLFGAASVVKTGAGNMDAFWASIDHKGDGEVGLFIGDITADAAGLGGNVWGGHFLLNLNIAANAYGHRVELNPSVDVSSKTQYAVGIANLNDAHALTQGLRIRGNFTNPLIVYSDAAGTAQIMTLDLSGNLTLKGSPLPLTNGLVDLGALGSRWRQIFVNNVSINGADGASGSGNLNLKNTAAAPSTNPVSGGVLYVVNGALTYKGSSGTVTTIAPA
jgi:hypothetical protein